MNSVYQHFRIDESALDRVTIWIDVCERSVNTLSEPILDELLQIIDAEPPPLGSHRPALWVFEPGENCFTRS